MEENKKPYTAVELKNDLEKLLEDEIQLAGEIADIIKEVGEKDSTGIFIKSCTERLNDICTERIIRKSGTFFNQFLNSF